MEVKKEKKKERKKRSLSGVAVHAFEEAPRKAHRVVAVASVEADGTYGEFNGSLSMNDQPERH